MKNHLTTAFYSLAEQHPEFIKGVQYALDRIPDKLGIYAGDNLFVYHRNLGFLDDERFMAAFNKHTSTEEERGTLWRLSTLVWAALNGMKLDGDFVEIACYKGTTARIVCDYLDLAAHPEKHYYLYDLFEHGIGMEHHSMPEHGQDLYRQVKDRFSDTPNVTVTQGKVPDILANVAPQKIAFMHLDLNNAEAEIGALEALFDRMVPGAIMVLDDYGWLGYREQKFAEDPWFAKRGYRVLELPTGQGLLVK